MNLLLYQYVTLSGIWIISNVHWHQKDTKDHFQVPPIIVTPMFSIWTIGPLKLKWTPNDRKFDAESISAVKCTRKTIFK